MMRAALRRSTSSRTCASPGSIQGDAMAGSDIVMMDASRKAQRITFPLLSLGSPAESLSRKPVLSLLQSSWLIDVEPVKIAEFEGFSLPTSGEHPHRQVCRASRRESVRQSDCVLVDVGPRKKK